MGRSSVFLIQNFSTFCSFRWNWVFENTFEDMVNVKWDLYFTRLNNKTLPRYTAGGECVLRVDVRGCT